MGRYHSKASLLEINAPCLETKAVGRRNGIWPTPEPNRSYIAFGGKSACNVQ
jgi:hypothetical protein